MKPTFILINLRVKRSADVTQLIMDKNALPEGVIRWSAITIINTTNQITAVKTGFTNGLDQILVTYNATIPANTLAGQTLYKDMTSEWKPFASCQTGVLNDDIQFVAYGVLIDAVPNDPKYPTPDQRY